jgi:5'-AMP-activated protein kinase catalytic alpha subunit
MHKSTGEIFAMKILDKERMVTLKIQHLVKNEIGIWRALEHPNIVKLNEVLASDAQIFIILEFAGGGELFDRIVAAGKLSEIDARNYFVQLLEALQYLHDKGVVHRDLKPENLLLSTAGQLKLADFGFAVLIDGLAKEEVCRQVGSPNYMAPELLTQAAADPEYNLELIDM